MTMGALCGLVLGAIVGYTAARFAADRAIAELKDIIQRGEQARKEGGDAGTPVK